MKKMAGKKFASSPVVNTPNSHYRIIIIFVLVLFFAVFAANFLLPRHPATAPVVFKTVESPVGRVVPSEVAYNLRQTGEDIVFVDIREKEEFLQEHLPGSIWIPHSKLRENDSEAWAKVEALAKSNKLVIFYCGHGYRSGWLASRAREKGFSNVFNLDGFNNWKKKYSTTKGPLNQDISPRLIHLEEAYFYSTNFEDVVFVDTRERSAIAKTGRIRNAVVLPLSSMPSALDTIQCDDDHVFYCGDANCTGATEVVKMVVGIKKCPVGRQKLMLEGFAAWKEAGYPVE